MLPWQAQTQQHTCYESLPFHPSLLLMTPILLRTQSNRHASWCWGTTSGRWANISSACPSMTPAPTSMEPEAINVVLNKKGMKSWNGIILPKLRLPMTIFASFVTKTLLNLIAAFDFLSTKPQQWVWGGVLHGSLPCTEGLCVANDTVERGVSYKRWSTKTIPSQAHGAILPKAARDSQVQSSQSKLETMSVLATHETTPPH